MGKRVYLVSEDSAAYADTQSGVAALESLGYHQCSREEYNKAIQRLSKDDGMVGEVMRHLETSVVDECVNTEPPKS